MLHTYSISASSKLVLTFFVTPGKKHNFQAVRLVLDGLLAESSCNLVYFRRSLFLILRNLLKLSAEPSSSLCGTFLRFSGTFLSFLRNLSFTFCGTFLTTFCGDFIHILTPFCSSTSSTVSRGLISVSAKSSTARSRLSRRTSCRRDRNERKKTRGGDRTKPGGKYLRVSCRAPRRVFALQG